MSSDILQIFQYGFIVRGIEAGVIVSLVAPLVGIFLVLRRYSLIADTLSHVSLAGIAGGMLFGIPPVISALAAAVAASFGIERLRNSRRLSGESALALFLSGSLALALILISLAHGFNANLFSYLFGSVVTVTNRDIVVIAALSVVIVGLIALFYKELVYVTFDEEAAQVSGIPTRLINSVLILLAAVLVALAIPVVGVLLISALIVIPVVSALQFRTGFSRTILIAESISVFSVVTGIFTSYFLDLSTGGTIVIVMLAIFSAIFFWKR